MNPPLRHLRAELRPMLSLAVPVVLAELGWMAMGVVDTMMVGRVSAEAIGAVAIGRALFFTVVVFGMGLLLGLDTLISRAFGAGRLDECRRALIHGVYLAVGLALPLTVAVRFVDPLLVRWGLDPGVLRSTLPYVHAVAWSTLPLLLYTTFRRYLQARNHVRPVMIALVSANLVNAAGNWTLIFGNLGAPALGAEGAGWATVISAWYLALFLAAVTWLADHEERARLMRTSLRLDPALLRRLLELGLPAGAQLLTELTVFAAATALAGWLDPVSLAAHTIVLTAASVTFMVPLGISSAAAVRVGQALGRGDAGSAAASGWTALLLGSAAMLFAALGFLLLPEPLVRLFTADALVVAAAGPLLVAAAVFQVSDGLQVVSTGALRGAGDTRTPFVGNLVGHWVFGLPVGYYLCFHRGWGVVGLWSGWVVGLTLLAVYLVRAWAGTAREFQDAARPGGCSG